MLDLATGTGDIAFEFAARGARVVGLDVTPRMIELARAKAPAGSPASFLVGDMLALPFPGGSFDFVTTGYGLRNVPDLAQAIDEILRVLKPGGQALSLDFDRPANALVRSAYSVVPDDRRRLARMDAASRSRHVPIHPGVDPPVSGRRQSGAG